MHSRMYKKYDMMEFCRPKTGESDCGVPDPRISQPIQLQWSFSFTSKCIKKLYRIIKLIFQVKVQKLFYFQNRMILFIDRLSQLS